MLHTFIILTGLFILLKPGQEITLSSFLPPPVYRIRIMILVLILALKTILDTTLMFMPGLREFRKTLIITSIWL